MKKMTKAEKIFKDTYFECMKHIRDWGLEYNENGTPIGYTGLITQETVSTRTCNAVRKEAEKESKRLDMNEKYEIRTAEQQKDRREALKMVEQTIKNQEKSIKEFNDWLKAI